MVAFRSRRLGLVLGVSLDGAQYQHFASLVTTRASEDFDLDFKRDLYGRSDGEKRKLAGDVAALANTASGGLIILGIEEDDQARAAAAPGVEISDAEISRIRQIIASLVAPLPAFEVLPSGDPSQPGRGFLVIAVPRSARAPHAVLVDEGLRFPVRHGRTTRYLTEPEVASAYRERFSSVHEVADRARQIEAGAAGRMKRADDHCWLLVSLVPELPGDLLVDHAALDGARREIVGRFPMIIPTNSSWHHADVGWRCLMLSGSRDAPRFTRWLAADLHSDGAGIFAVNVIDSFRSRRTSSADPDPSIGVHDEELINGILSGLRFLAQHARDRVGAGGDALIRAQIHAEDGSRKVLLSAGFRSSGDSMGRDLHFPARTAQAAAPLDALADDGPGLVSASSLLANDLFQQFGLPEAIQITRDGELRRPYWGSARHPQIEEWANRAGITLTDEILPLS